MVSKLNISEEYSEYLKDESRVIGTAESISFPKNEAEVIKIMKEMCKTSTQVTIQGARTGISAGAVPFGGHIMNLSKMDNVLGMRKDKNGIYNITVQPGVILSNLRERISKRRFNTTVWDDASKKDFIIFCNDQEHFFAPDPTEASATIGGMVACNASGARSYKYGSTRDHISAIRVVLSSGDVISLKRGQTLANGRKSTLITDAGRYLELELPKYIMPKAKNTSAYYVSDNMDMIDLFIGADGTLGIISEIELKLLPLPQYIWGVTTFFNDRDKAIQFVCEARESIKSIASIEYFDGNALDILRRQRKSNPGFARIPHLPEKMSEAVFVELHSLTEDLNLKNTFELQNIMDSLDVQENRSWVARNDVDRDLLYFFRHAVPESVNMLIDGFKKENPSLAKLGTDMSVPNNKLKEIIDIYNEKLAESGLKSATWGHIGDNHLHVNILPMNASEYEQGKELYMSWAETVVKYGGAISAEHGVGKLKVDLLKVMYGDQSIIEMKELKKQLDPKELLGVGTLFAQGDR